MTVPVQTNPASVLGHCDTLMFDMDGTLLDLAFDNYMWLQHIPAAYARERGIDEARARDELYRQFRDLEGQLDWYCLDHWSERLGLDVLGLHRAEHRRIDWLPGAKRCLELLAAGTRRLLLVTNSHPATLRIKHEVTGITDYFDRIVTSHEIGHAKESQAFWQALSQVEDFDKQRTLFVDDTQRVLQSAERYGLQNLLLVTRPDTTRKRRSANRFTGIDGVLEIADRLG